MITLEMNYCMECGGKLHLKYHETEEREIPYCDNCGDFRYPVFNTAISAIILNEAKDRVYLIKQYGKPTYVLVAGYVNQGEDAEDAVRREIREEMGFTVTAMRFNRSHYYERSNTLMLNFTVTVAEDCPHPNWEIDSWSCFTVEEAKNNIRPHSLAQIFLNGYFSGEYPF